MKILFMCVANLNFVITLWAEEVCPAIFAPQAKKLHWPFKDPASHAELIKEVQLTRFHEARDAIRVRLIEMARLFY